MSEVLETPVPETEVDQEPTIREALETAFDEAEATETTAAPAETNAVPAAKPEESVAPPPPPSAAPTPPVAPVVPAPPPAGAAVASPPLELKAPAQWKPHVREKWNTLPREVQEEIHRREGDSMRLIGSVGPKIRLADEVSHHIADFLPRLQEVGVPASAFIADVFTSVKSLTSPNPQERAEVVANIVQSYGVDLRVLDQILTQRIKAGPSDAQARAATARANIIIQQNQQQQRQNVDVENQKALAAFAGDPKHEFFDDVRGLMADLLDAGRVKTLDDAYAAAIWAHGDTRKILLQREAQTRAASKNQRAQVARRASASVHGAPVSGNGAAGVPQNLSLRDTIAAAMDEHSPLS